VDNRENQSGDHSFGTESSGREYSIAVMRHFLAIWISLHLAAAKLQGTSKQNILGGDISESKLFSEDNARHDLYWVRSYGLIRNTQNLPALYIVIHTILSRAWVEQYFSLL
jgi:hypothetical protein